MNSIPWKISSIGMEATVLLPLSDIGPLILLLRPIGYDP
jgi:hypothetical protein